MTTTRKTGSGAKKSAGVKSNTKTSKTVKANKKNNSDKQQAALKKQKKKTNLLKLCSEMNIYAEDANDKEIIKRFKTTITSSVGEDISKISLFTILKKPEEIKIADYNESIQPYIKHYVFMLNRSLSKKPNKNRKPIIYMF